MATKLVTRKPDYLQIIKEALRQFDNEKARPEALYKQIEQLARIKNIIFSRKTLYFYLNIKRPKEIKKISTGRTHVEYQLIESRHEEEYEKHMANSPKLPTQSKFKKMNSEKQYETISNIIDWFYLEYLRHATFYDIEKSLPISCEKTDLHKKMENMYRLAFRKVLKSTYELSPQISNQYSRTLMEKYGIL